VRSASLKETNVNVKCFEAAPVTNTSSFFHQLTKKRRILATKSFSREPMSYGTNSQQALKARNVRMSSKKKKKNKKRKRERQHASKSKRPRRSRLP